MTTAFAKMGFSGDFGGHWFLSRLVGPARARELYFTSEMPDAALREEALALARRLGDGPRVAWRYMKRNMKAAEEGTLADALDAEAIGMMRCQETEDHREALRAFLEKRPPAFKGR